MGNFDSLNDPIHLKSIGLELNDIWTPSIQGIMHKPHGQLRGLPPPPARGLAKLLIFHHKSVHEERGGGQKFLKICPCGLCMAPKELLENQHDVLLINHSVKEVWGSKIM